MYNKLFNDLIKINKRTKSNQHRTHIERNNALTKACATRIVRMRSSDTIEIGIDTLLIKLWTWSLTHDNDTYRCYVGNFNKKYICIRYFNVLIHFCCSGLETWLSNWRNFHIPTMVSNKSSTKWYLPFYGITTTVSGVLYYL